MSLENKDSLTVLKGRSILVVEDSAPLAMDVEDILLEAGSTVVGPVSTVSEALNLLAKEIIEAALLDINLDGEKVFPVAKELKSKNVPFLFLSGYNPENLLPDEFVDCRCVQKPITEDILLRYLSEFFS